MKYILISILICNFISIVLGIKPVIDSKKMEKRFNEWLKKNDKK